jgi:hypothetical protein
MQAYKYRIPLLRITNSRVFIHAEWRNMENCTNSPPMSLNYPGQQCLYYTGHEPAGSKYPNIGTVYLYPVAWATNVPCDSDVRYHNEGGDWVPPAYHAFTRRAYSQWTQLTTVYNFTNEDIMRSALYYQFEHLPTLYYGPGVAPRSGNHSDGPGFPTFEYRYGRKQTMA